MKTIEQWTEIRASVEQVFAFLNEDKRMQGWLQNLSTTPHLASAESSAHTKLHDASQIEAINAEPNRFIAWHIASASKNLKVEISLEETLLRTTLLRLALSDEAHENHANANQASGFEFDDNQKLESSINELKHLIEANDAPTLVASALTTQAAMPLSPSTMQAATSLTASPSTPSLPVTSASSAPVTTIPYALDESDVRAFAPTANAVETNTVETNAVETNAVETNITETYVARDAAPDDITQDALDRNVSVMSDDFTARETLPIERVSDAREVSITGEVQSARTASRTGLSESRSVVVEAAPRARQTARSRRTRRNLWRPLLAAFALGGLGLLVWLALQNNWIQRSTPDASSTAATPSPQTGRIAPDANTAQPSDAQVDAPREVTINPSETDSTVASPDAVSSPNDNTTAGEGAGIDGNEDVQTQLRSRLDEWTAATSQQDMRNQMEFYAPELERYYLRRNFSRNAVEAEKQRLASRAQLVELRVEGEPEITLDRDGQTATMTFLKRYDIKANNQVSRGAVIQELKWRKTADGWKIISERDLRVVR